MPLGDGKFLSSVFGDQTKPGNRMSSKSNPPAGAKAIRSQRIRTLAASVNELNKTLSALFETVEPAVKKLDVVVVRDVVHELAVSVDALTSQLEKTTVALHKLSENRTLMGLAFSSDGDEVLNQLCDSVEAIAKQVTEIRAKFA